MPTVEQPVRERHTEGGRKTQRPGPTANAGRAISVFANEHLAAIDDLVCQLREATDSYRSRPLDWADVASLKLVREHLDGAVKGFTSAVAAAEVTRAAREVATAVRQFRTPDQSPH